MENDAILGVRDLPGIRNFTATGRSYDPSSKSAKRGSSMDALMASDSWGASPGNTLAVKFNDDSLISVPVLRNEDMRQPRLSSPTDEKTGSLESEAEAQGKEKRRRLSSLFRHKHSHSQSSSSSSSKYGENFTIRQITRREYLAHYAKDDAGQYIGTDDPAEDCILRGEDLERWRGREGMGEWRNEIPAPQQQRRERSTEGNGGSGSEKEREREIWEEGEREEKKGAAATRMGRLFRGLKGAKDDEKGDIVIH